MSIPFIAFFYIHIPMSSSYNAPIEVRGLENMLRDFTYQNGFDIGNVFDDLLTFIIHGWSPSSPPLKKWSYTNDQTAVFYNMYREWVTIMDKQTISKSWYDAFGDLFMATVVSSSGQKYKGQFFTPPHICDLMSAIISGTKHPKTKILDPTCGSGRLLLAHHALYPQDILVGKDISITCCMMTVCNFLVHACDSLVICCNALDPSSFIRGWRINERLSFTGIPCIREITGAEYFQHYK